MVKCSECGFLSVRNRFNRLLDEAEQSYRDTLRVAYVPRTRPYEPSLIGSFGLSIEELHEELPICFENVLSFRSLAYDKAKAKDSGRTDANYIGRMSDGGWDVTEGDFQEVLAEERDCPRWTKWRQGSTPKEHREMLDRENFLKWQATREEADREWRTKEAEKDRQWRAEQEKIRSRKEEEGQRLRLRWEIIIFGVIVTLILVAAQIASAFIGRGDLFGSAPVRQVSDTRGLQPPVNP